jgi:hypothetical protein
LKTERDKVDTWTGLRAPPCTDTGSGPAHGIEQDSASAANDQQPLATCPFFADRVQEGDKQEHTTMCPHSDLMIAAHTSSGRSLPVTEVLRTRFARYEPFRP